MKKSSETKKILIEWRNFENKNLNENQGASSSTGRIKPDVSERARKLLKKLEEKFGVGPFYDYSHFDDFGDDDMYYEPRDAAGAVIGPPDGIQLDYQDVIDWVKSTGEIEVDDINLGDFITAEDDGFYESGKSARDLNITKAGIANLPSGEYAEFGFIELDDGERIPVVYTTSHGYTIYRFIPVEYDAQQPAKTFKSSLGKAWD
tara:strand:- start:702 stop:1313 length:612 start_codon:yes stop_codon:yes gene_type:complete